MAARDAESIARPTGPAAWNQTAMTLIRAAASTPRATPSRRCSGGRSRAVAALRPAARASPPSTVASARHTAAIALPMPMNGAAQGLRPRRLGAVLVVRPDDFRVGGRVRVPIAPATGQP
jgi:hypothetical protein